MPDRIQIKEEAKQVVRGARVNAYLVTLIVLIITSMRNKRENQPPAALGLSYFREER